MFYSSPTGDEDMKEKVKVGGGGDGEEMNGEGRLRSKKLYFEFFLEGFDASFWALKQINIQIIPRHFEGIILKVLLRNFLPLPRPPVNYLLCTIKKKLNKLGIWFFKSLNNRKILSYRNIYIVVGC